MGSEVTNRQERARLLMRLLERRHFDAQLGRHRIRYYWEHEADVIPELAKLHGQETFEAVAADVPGRVFCNLWLVLDCATDKIRLGGDKSVVWAGIVRAARAALKRKDRDITALVKSSVAAELAERRDERIAVLRRCGAGELLPRLLRGVRQGLHENMTVHIDHLTSKQRSDLLAALRANLGDDSVACVRMDHEPEDPHKWLYWYLYHSEFAKPEMHQSLGGIPRYVLSAPRGSVRSSSKSDAGVIIPLGPMLAHVYKALARELSKHGRQIKDPESVKRIAELLNVSHGTASAWLKEDLPGLVIRPDGKGGVFWDFNVSTVQRSMEIAKGNKRGPKPRRQ